MWRCSFDEDNMPSIIMRRIDRIISSEQHAIGTEIWEIKTSPAHMHDLIENGVVTMKSNMYHRRAIDVESIKQVRSSQSSFCLLQFCVCVSAVRHMLRDGSCFLCDAGIC
jgi:hypothetical protein